MRMATLSLSDIGLVASILHERGQIVGLDRSHSRVEFLFEDSPALREIIRKYWSDELLCPAQALLISFKRAKHILHDYSV
jgi:hypothetical protein